MDKTLESISGGINILLGVALFYAAVFASSPSVTLPFVILGGFIGVSLVMRGVNKTVAAGVA